MTVTRCATPGSSRVIFLLYKLSPEITLFAETVLWLKDCELCYKRALPNISRPQVLIVLCGIYKHTRICWQALYVARSSSGQCREIPSSPINLPTVRYLSVPILLNRMMHNIMVANQLKFIIPLLLCMLTAATDNANLPYKFCCPTLGECSLVDISKYHLYNEVSLTELIWYKISYYRRLGFNCEFLYVSQLIDLQT